MKKMLVQKIFYFISFHFTSLHLFYSTTIFLNQKLLQMHKQTDRLTDSFSATITRYYLIKVLKVEGMDYGPTPVLTKAKYLFLLFTGLFQSIPAAAYQTTFFIICSAYIRHFYRSNILYFSVQS